MHSREVKGNQTEVEGTGHQNIKVQSPTKLEPVELEKTETTIFPSTLGATGGCGSLLAMLSAPPGGWARTAGLTWCQLVQLLF